MKGIKRTIRVLWAVGFGCMPLAAAAHLLDGSPDPLPRWVPIAGLIIASVMGGIVGFAINKHRQSMERLKKQRQQRAAESAGKSPSDYSVTDSAPPDSAP